MCFAFISEQSSICFRVCLRMFSGIGGWIFFDWVGAVEDLYLRKELSSGGVAFKSPLNLQCSAFTKLLHSVRRSRHISTLAGPVPKASKYLRPSTEMRLSPFILVAAATFLAGFAAPIDKWSFYYKIKDTNVPNLSDSSPDLSAPLDTSSSPNCYRRWRHHGSHLAFCLSRLHTCCREPMQQQQQRQQKMDQQPLQEQALDNEPRFFISGIVPRRRRP